MTYWPPRHFQIDTRYPDDQGLLPHVKPTMAELTTFIKFCVTIFDRLNTEMYKQR